VVLTGAPGSPGFRALASVLQAKLGPRRAVIALDAPGAREWFSRNSPWLRHLGEKDGESTAYVCEEFTCRSPARTPEDLERALAAPSVA
jgi:hypothetical protein